MACLKHFAIYARTGELLFDRKNFNINDASYGWDGRYNGKGHRGNPGIKPIEDRTMNKRIGILMLLLGIGLLSFQACKKKDTPAAPSPAAAPTATFTFTNTPVPPCVNASNTPCTSTYTVTSTPTVTPTITRTPTVTSTPTVYTFTTESFEGGTTVPANWYGSMQGGGTSSPLDISTINSYSGTNSLHMTATFAGAGNDANIFYYMNPPDNFTGKTVSLKYYIDQLPTASGSRIEFWIESMGGSYPVTVIPSTGTWVDLSLPVATGAGIPSAVTEVDFYLYSGSTGPFNAVNIYLDDLSIQ